MVSPRENDGRTANSLEEEGRKGKTGGGCEEEVVDKCTFHITDKRTMSSLVIIRWRSFDFLFAESHAERLEEIVDGFFELFCVCLVVVVLIDFDRLPEHLFFADVLVFEAVEGVDLRGRCFKFH